MEELKRQRDIAHSQLEQERKARKVQKVNISQLSCHMLLGFFILLSIPVSDTNVQFHHFVILNLVMLFPGIESTWTF